MLFKPSALCAIKPQAQILLGEKFPCSVVLVNLVFSVYFFSSQFFRQKPSPASLARFAASSTMRCIAPFRAQRSNSVPRSPIGSAPPSPTPKARFKLTPFPLAITQFTFRTKASEIPSNNSSSLRTLLLCATSLSMSAASINKKKSTRKPIKLTRLLPHATRAEIAELPGASRTNSLDFVTAYTPGAYMVHDQLHIRGGHQVSWLVD